MSCCDTNGLSGIFDAARAEADARSYRRGGLGKESRAIADYLISRGIAGATVLEIGGGVGALQIELVRAGAARAASVEVSPAYERVASELAAEKDVADRIERRVADFAREADAVAPADAVILNKVVCCYPDMPALVKPAAAHARRWLVLVFPADRWFIRLGFGFAGAVQALFRSRFRIFFHEPAAISGIAAEAGMRIALSRRGFVWELLALERA